MIGVGACLRFVSIKDNGSVGLTNSSAYLVGKSYTSRCVKETVCITIGEVVQNVILLLPDLTQLLDALTLAGTVLQTVSTYSMAFIGS